MSEYTKTQEYLDLAVQSSDLWLKDRALQRAATELTTLQSEVERLRGRCAELELRAVDYLKTASGLAEPKERIKARIKLEDAINHCPDPMPFIRGKQAEAVEQAAKELSTIPGAALWDFEEVQDWLGRAYAPRLRQQAAEIEK